MKKKITNKKALVLVSALIITVSAIGGVYAKYVAKISGTGSLSVAKWVFNAELKKDKDGNLDLGSKSYNAETLTTGKIAPGTSGSFDIKIDANGTETGVDYTVKFSEIKNKPTNLYFVVGDTKCTTFDELSNALSGHFDANTQNKEITKNVEWKWDYETTENGKNAEENDAVDSQDGENAKDFSFKADVVGIQTQPK